MFAANWSAAGGGLAAEPAAVESGQREATTDCGASAPAVLSWLTAGLAGIAGSRASLRLGGSMLVCAGHSAWASATEGCIGAVAAGVAVAEEFAGAVCDSFSPSPRRYQQWRLLARSMR